MHVSVAAQPVTDMHGDEGASKGLVEEVFRVCQVTYQQTTQISVDSAKNTPNFLTCSHFRHNHQLHKASIS
jgi:hypothetical protein